MIQEDALELARQFAQAVRQVLQIEEIRLFGPWAEGTATGGEDIDVAVIAEETTIRYGGESTALALWNLSQSVSQRIDPVLLVRERTDPAFLANLEEKGILV